MSGNRAPQQSRHYVTPLLAAPDLGCAAIEALRSAA